MKFNDKIYNFFKWSLIIFVPALLTLLSTISQLYKFDIEKYIILISSISTFLGILTGISNYNYNNTVYDEFGNKYNIKKLDEFNYGKDTDNE